jgi:hypothetical protein
MPLTIDARVGNQTGKETKQHRDSSPLRQLVLADPEDQDRIVQWSDQLFDLTYRARQPYQDAWSDFYDWARGNQWDPRRPPWRSHFKSNYIFAAVMSRTAVLTDSRPIIRARPRTEKDLEVVQEEVNPLLEFLWETQRMDASFAEAVAGAVILGTYYLKPYWDPTLAQGKGDAATSIVDPSTVWNDGGALAVNGPDGGEFIFHVEPRSLEWIERMFPERGHEVEPEDIPMDFFGGARTYRRALNRIPVDEKPWIRNLPIIGPLFGRRGQQADQMADSDIPRALVFELWVRDGKVDGSDEDGYSERYPRGRRICYANRVLLTPDKESQQSPYPDARFPFVRMRNYVWPGEYFGGSDVEQTMPIQQEMNLARARISDHMANFTNGKWVIQKGSGIDTNTLSNSPTQIIEPRRMEMVKRLDGLPLPEGQIAFLTVCQRDFENVGAYQESTQGRVPERIQSGLAIQELKEAAFSRVRLTERGIKESLEEWADLSLGLVRHYYDGKRVVSVTDQKGASAFITIEPGRIPERLDFEATVGSQILRGQQKISNNDAIQLFQAGLIDQQAALEAIDFPEAKSLVARTDNAKATIMNLVKADPAFRKALVEELQGVGGANGGTPTRRM